MIVIPCIMFQSNLKKTNNIKVLAENYLQGMIHSKAEEFGLGMNGTSNIG
jgi:hypothetical protein